MREGRTRRRVVTVLGAAMYALLAGLGYQAQKLGARGTSDLPRALITAAALFVPAYVLLACLLRWSEGKKAAVQRGKPFRAGRAFWLILACYVPMFAITFPGSFAYDVPFQLEQVFTDSYSTHHPLLHTLLMGSLVKLGHHFGNINLGAALYTLVQMAVMAGCSSSTSTTFSFLALQKSFNIFLCLLSVSSIDTSSKSVSILDFRRYIMYCSNSKNAAIFVLSFRFFFIVVTCPHIYECAGNAIFLMRFSG